MAPLDSFGDTQHLFGRSTPRVDGADKVTGAARYAADEPVANPAFACLVTSRIARGRITSFDLVEAMSVAGVLDILTHENVGDQAKTDMDMMGGPSTTTLENAQVWHNGQIIGVVIAETFEAAREAANKVRVAYDAAPPSATFDSPGAKEEPGKPMFGPPPMKGDADKALAEAPVKVDAAYATPTQHHNAIELFTTTCVWTART